MSKELDAFNTVVEMFNQYANKPNHIGEFLKFTNACQDVEKALKALEIIKAKKVDTELIKSSEDYFEYCASTYRTKVTGEEYELLKEILYVQEEENRP